MKGTNVVDEDDVEKMVDVVVDATIRRHFEIVLYKKKADTLRPLHKDII